jgi:putative NIF3 family GTP cyclohydrolase 1 type 2
MRILVSDLTDWLSSLCEDSYSEDGLQIGSGDMQVTGVLFCWFANKAARAAALERGANVIVGHEPTLHDPSHPAPGCPPCDTWDVNVESLNFYEENKVAFVRSHRTCDAYCIPRVFGEHLGFPEPVVDSGWKGYNFTLAYDLTPQPFGQLVDTLKVKMGYDTVRTSACAADKIVTRVGMGWGGVANCRNLQYMELLRQHGVEVIIGGEIDEYGMEYYRDSGLEWIELGHYASEIIGMKKVAQDMATAFPGLKTSTFDDAAHVAFR